jgi:hypothetical protein
MVTAQGLFFGWSGRHPVSRFAIPEGFMDQSTQDSSQLGGCLVRVLWMAVGNLVLVLAAVSIAQSGRGFTLTLTDAIFAVTALCLPIVRYVDISRFHGKTADSQPATMAHWFRYTATILGGSLVLWLIAHSIS